MTKYLSAMMIALMAIFNLPTSFANEEQISVNLISQSHVWITDRPNISFVIEDESGNTISNAEVEISKSALLGRSAIRSIIAKPNSVDYKRIFETTTLAQNENQYTLTLPGPRLKFSGAGTYALRIKVYVRGEAKTLTSFISFLPESIRLNNLNVATVLPMVVNSGLTPDNLVLNDKAANSFLNDAGLNSVLSSSKSMQNVTWLLDSDTLRLAQSISANQAITMPENHDLSEEQISGAQTWLDELPKYVNSENTYLLPTGNVNTVALKDSGHNRLAKFSILDSQYVSDFLEGISLKKITIAPKGDYSDAGFTWLNSQQISFNLLNSKAYPAKSSTYTPNAVVRDGAGAVAPVVDQYASALFTDAISSATNAGMYQAAFAGDLLITSLEQPGVQRFIVLKPDTNRDGITNQKFRNTVSSLSAPWIKQVSLSKFKDSKVGSRVRNQVVNRISNTAKNLMNLTHETKRNLASLIAGATEETQIDFAILRLANSSADEKTQNQLHTQIRDYLDRLNGAVRIMSSGTVVFPSESAKVPITIRNDLSVPIEIGIVTSGLPAVRVLPQSVDDMQIAPGRRKSIEIPTRLIGTDTAYLQLQIVDLNGKRIGNPILIQVSSSAYAQAAAWVIGAAFALLLLFAIRNTLKRLRATRDGSQENMKL